MSAKPDSSADYLLDRPVLSPTQTRLLGVLAPIVVAAIGVGLAATDYVDRLENVTIDWRFRARGPRRPRSDIVVVEINEQSRLNLSEPRRRFDLRKHVATAVNNLADAGAAIGLDMWFQGLADPETDARLADALSDADVVLAVTHVEGKLLRFDPLFRAADPPLPEGTVTVYPDPDGVLRRLPQRLHLDVLHPDGSLSRIPHFPLVAALYGLVEQDPTIAIEFADDEVRMGHRHWRGGELIDYVAPPGHGWRTLSFEDAVRGRFDPDMVDGAVVLIGETRTVVDHFTLPLTGTLVPGVYYHANVIAQVLDNRRFATYLTDGTRPLWLTGMLGLAVGLFAWNQRPWWKYRHGTTILLLYLNAGLAVFLGGWTYAAFRMFNDGVLVPYVGAFVAMGLSLGTGMVAQWVFLSANARRLAERNRRIESLFGRSVSHNVLAALKANPQDIAQTRVRDVSVLFCDLRGFTATAAELAPEEVAEMLNEYFDHITEAVFEHDGFIDKFVGDEVMAVFSAPLFQPDHAARAVRTAIAIKQRLAKLNKERIARGQGPLNCGIGVHTGPAAAGHIGASARSNYTVVGHTVNLAARVEQLATSGEILVSEAVRDLLPGDITVHPWKKVTLPGIPEECSLSIAPDAVGEQGS